MYEYFWGYTSAQIELMMADCPIIVYPNMKNKEKRNDTNKTPQISGHDITTVAEEWKKKYGQGGTEIKLDLSGYSLSSKQKLQS